MTDAPPVDAPPEATAYQASGWRRLRLTGVALGSAAATFALGSALFTLMSNPSPAPRAPAAPESAPTPGRSTGAPPPAPPGAPAPTAAPVPTTPGVAAPSPAGPVPSGTAEEPPPYAPLTARYSAEDRTGPLGVTGYRGRVVISNPGTGTVTGWRVTVTLPAGQQVSSASGASFAQDGRVATFTPGAATRRVAPDRPVEFTFDVLGVLPHRPSGCAIDGRPCA